MNINRDDTFQGGRKHCKIDMAFMDSDQPLPPFLHSLPFIGTSQDPNLTNGALKPQPPKLVVVALLGDVTSVFILIHDHETDSRKQRQE